MKRAYTLAYMVMLVALVVVAIHAFTQAVPVLAPLGLLMAASAPLVYFGWLYSAGSKPGSEPLEAHPVLPSAVAGLGAVISAVAVYRFGDDWRGYLAAGIAALIGWMIYVRWAAKPDAPKDS